MSLVSIEDLEYGGGDPLQNSLHELIPQIRELKRDIQGNWFELGALFNELATICGKGGRFAETLKFLNIPSSTATYLRNMRNRFDAMQIDPPSGISWRHIAEVYRFLTPLNFEWVMSYCRTHTREELIELCQDGFFEE